MKKIQINIFLAMLLILCFTTGCSYVKHNAVLYDSSVNFINEKFQSQNLIRGSLDNDENKNDYPATRTFIVKNQEDFEKIFVYDFSEFEIDFDKEMLIVYTFLTEYVLPAKITNMTLNGETLTIEFSFDLIKGTGSAVRPFQRWFVIKLDNLNISSVVFTKK